MLGGGGGHGGHHGGGRGRGGFYGPGWWGGGYYDPGVQLFTIDDGDRMPSPSACPKTRQPVLASDGLVYDNACFARAAGVKAVKVVGQPQKTAAAKVVGKTPMKGFGAFTVSVDDQNVTPGFWLGVATGIVGLTIARAIFR